MPQPPPIQFPEGYTQRPQRPGQQSSDVPIPTTRAPPRRTPSSGGNNLRRAKTLVRPERGVAQAPLINPPAPMLSSAGTALPSNSPLKSPADSWDAWRIFSLIITFWAPGFLLSSLGQMKDKATRQAWREKIALCFIALVLGGTVGFATVGLDKALCPNSQGFTGSQFARLNSTSSKGLVSIQGYLYNVTSADTGAFDFFGAVGKLSGVDVTPQFKRAASDFKSCANLQFKAAKDDPCPTASPCPLPALGNATFTQLHIFTKGLLVGYDWAQVAALKNFLVMDGFVLNMQPYMNANPTATASDKVDKALRKVLVETDASGGKDATLLFSTDSELKAAIPCLVERYLAGNIDKTSPGCFIASLMLYASMMIILSVVLARFAMACIFNWFISRSLVQTPKNLSRKVISPAVMPEGANVTVDNQNGTAPWAKKSKVTKGKPGKQLQPASGTPTAPVISMATIGSELFCVCLVTCYSEGEESIKGTLDSIAMTSYSDSRKLLFIVCDGMITGAGETRSTPDICVGLLDADPRFGNPTPMSYVAVGLGSKKENRAMVYAGHYVVKGRRTPTVVVVKCGTEAEAANEKKPGNRGKRDSQLILMNFFSRVTYNDRMTPLDYDLFRKVQVLMGVTPDFFEVTLMVDADTRVLPDSLTHLVNCMHHDNYIMGVCGETRIQNKRQSWVTAIQVYEYFISHHLAKAFESVFGGVTCLPGCFSMYRLKARKANDDDWVPLITKPEIVKEYSQSEVTTLHQKNLLLLGEDRFLTTILLRTFPNRKMMFCPQAKCRTVVPDTFYVLLSQRRRWINSTIHNLMELVLVQNLCGTFCFSMQFVVFMDLLGTVVLPVAITLTYWLIAAMAINPPKNFEQSIPLILLCSVIGLPAVLILITTRKVVYVFWMFIYLAALPVWNFVLPVYAFWHFDDFSWGETRKVEGEGKQKGHDEGGPLAEGTQVPMRRWEDWERSRIRKLKREAQKKRDMERHYPGGLRSAPRGPEAYSMAFSEFNDDSTSLAPSEDDRWGAQVGGYNENSSQWAPPPLAFPPQGDVLQSAETVAGNELEAILERGFDYKENRDSSTTMGSNGPFLDSRNQSRFQLSDQGVMMPPPSGGRFDSYAPVSTRTPSPGPGGSFPDIHSPLSPTNGSSSALDFQTHVKKRSNGGRLRNDSEEILRAGGGPSSPSQNDWGPLGPLDPQHSPQTNPRNQSGRRI
ncbi:glycosyltransferase family 2 protein [Serendipita vermifera]|nr:glycosyltransferase family 2 protein [Serendipita vermifera]